MESHRWDVSISEAKAIQKSLRERIRIEPLAAAPRTIAGADVSFGRFSDVFFAGVIVLSFPALEVLEYSLHTMRVSFPYVPGYLSFREVPAIVGAFNALTQRPDVLIMDGHGIAHPRRLGVASHLGLVLDIPTIGCAKSVLFGEGVEPASEPGSISPLYAPGSEEVIGARLRTRARANPVIVSPGHRITLDDALRIVEMTVVGYRIPEPTRQAHLLVNRYRRGEIHA